MPKKHEIALGLVLASAFWALLIVLNSDTSAYHQVCETNQYTGKESCAPHHIPYVIAWYVGHWFDLASSVITAFATAAIAYFTWTIKRINDTQLAHSHQIERAYMSGGGVAERQPFQQLINGALVQRYSLTGRFEVHINNYGKTAGELLEIAVDFCDADKPPAEPSYERRPLHTWIAPGEKGVPIDAVDPPTNRPATAVYGRFFYRDIFGRNWSCGFIQSIDLSTGETAHIRAPAGYTGNREED